MQEDSLQPCKVCGEPCRVEVFTGPHIQGEAILWLCSDNRMFGGKCPDTIAYLTEDEWNAR